MIARAWGIVNTALPPLRPALLSFIYLTAYSKMVMSFDGLRKV